MKKTRFNINFFIVLNLLINISSLSFGQNNNSLGLLEAVKIALESNSNIRAVESERMAANYGLKKARANYWPSLALSGNYAHLSKVNEMVINLPSIGQQTFAIGTDDPFNSDLMLSWDVYTFGRRSSSVKLAGIESELTDIKLQNSQKQLFDNVARAYLTTVFTGNALGLSRAEKDRAAKILELVTNRYDKQLIPEFDLLQMQLRYEQHRLTELEFEEDIETAKLNLARLLAIDIEELPELRDSLDFEFTLITASESNDRNYENRDDYLQVQKQIELAEYSRKSIRSSYFPNITLFGDYNMRNGYQPDLDEIENVFSFGVNFNWLLFDGFSRKAELNNQGYLQKASQYYQDDLAELIPYQINVANNILLKKVSNIEVGERSLKVAQKAMDIAQQRYDLGDISMIELLEAENQLSEAELRLLKLRFDKAMAALDLKAAAGYYPEINAVYK